MRAAATMRLAELKISREERETERESKGQQRGCSRFTAPLRLSGSRTNASRIQRSSLGMEIVATKLQGDLTNRNREKKFVVVATNRRAKGDYFKTIPPGAGSVGATVKRLSALPVSLRLCQRGAWTMLTTLTVFVQSQSHQSAITCTHTCCTNAFLVRLTAKLDKIPHGRGSVPPPPPKIK